MTKVAWSKKRAEILQIVPAANKQRVVFNLRRGEYEKRFGTDYERPHGFARFLSWIYMLIPKVGPFRILKFSVPTPEAERLFLASFISTREHFHRSLEALNGVRLTLTNTDFDTGKATKRGRWPTRPTTSCSTGSPTASSRGSRSRCGRISGPTTATRAVCR
jgi:hypothetical protein